MFQNRFGFLIQRGFVSRAAAFVDKQEVIFRAFGGQDINLCR